MYPAFFMAMSGLQASGKSTLAKTLARRLGWSYIAESMAAKQYLDDFFKNPKELAFETQLAFLCNKALLILQKLHRGENIILDRTLYEDCYIFGKYWKDRGDITDRDFQTYTALAKHFLEEIPPPDLIIYSTCSLKVAETRIVERNRLSGGSKSYQNKYPPDHLKDILGLYKKWVKGYRDGAIYSIDSEAYDFRDRQVVDKIYSEIADLISTAQATNDQLDLFSGSARVAVHSSPIPKILRRISDVKSNLSTKKPFKEDVPNQNWNPVSPYAYIAAPFTTVAVDQSLKTDKSELFNLPPPHGRINRGAFRNCLLATARAMRGLGLNTLLPHRDVNQWGKKILTPKKVFELCTRHVSQCDLFVGVLGNSVGAHYEFGLAAGLDKPIILVHCAELNDSFMSQGVSTDSKNNLVLECDRLKEVPRLLKSKPVKDFIRRNLTIIKPL
jgi:deoxyadenosine/deoxycytidine kinase